MKISFISLFLSLVFFTANANAGCMYKSYTETDGSVSELEFPVPQNNEQDFIKLGYQKKSCSKNFDKQTIQNKCAKMINWPAKIKNEFKRKFNIYPEQMCQNSLAYAQSQQ